MLFFYTGFLVGTLCCALATDYHYLLIARIITGLFGGVIGSISFAIVTDLFPFEQRGRVMGTIQSALSASQVLGIPFGLYLSTKWNWHAPFFLIVAVGLLVGLVMVFCLKPIRGHLDGAKHQSPIIHLFRTVSKKRYLQGFATTALLSIGGFMLMPFGSTFNVQNVGIRVDDLPLVYIVTGIFSMFFGPLVGRYSDKIGKFKIFLFGSIVTVVAASIYCRLSQVPLAMLIAISVVMFLGVSTRMITASALTSAVPEASDRGAYMAVSSSLQQISGGLGAIFSGMIVVQNGEGPLLHFDRIANILAGTTLLSVVMMYFLNRYVQAKHGTKRA